MAKVAASWRWSLEYWGGHRPQLHAPGQPARPAASADTARGRPRRPATLPVTLMVLARWWSHSGKARGMRRAHRLLDWSPPAISAPVQDVYRRPWSSPWTLLSWGLAVSHGDAAPTTRVRSDGQAWPAVEHIGDHHDHGAAQSPS